MKLQNEINLNLVTEEGENFIFDAEMIKNFSIFESVSIFDPLNSVSIFMMPIGTKHFEVKAKINLKRPLNCSRCGEGFEDWFKEEIVEYLSLDKDEEGEDKGFLILESPKWDWSSFIVESVELETPYQLYKNGDECLKSCVHYDEAVKNGWISKPEQKANAFSALESLKGKLS
jgi:uncharacterized metal-binding protein YceD (DUF177 family)